MMAVRLARAFTGKSKLIRSKHHFHGWHDHMTSVMPAISTAADARRLPGVAASCCSPSRTILRGSPAARNQQRRRRGDHRANRAHGAQLPIDPKF